MRPDKSLVCRFLCPPRPGDGYLRSLWGLGDSPTLQRPLPSILRCIFIKLSCHCPGSPGEAPDRGMEPVVLCDFSSKLFGQHPISRIDHRSAPQQQSLPVVHARASETWPGRNARRRPALVHCWSKSASLDSERHIMGRISDSDPKPSRSCSTTK